MPQINVVLVVIGLLSEMTLLGLLFRRGYASRVPIFAGLLAFYVLRSLLLTLTAGRVPGGSRLALEASFAVGDVLLQVCLAAMLFIQVSRGSGKTPAQTLTWTRLLLLPVGMVLASLCTAGLAWATHAYSPVPADRGVLLCGFLFLSIFLVTWPWAQPGFEQHLLRDFAFLSAIAIASQVGRTLAAAHREPRVYLFWVYLNAAVWLWMLATWTLRVWRAEPKRTTRDGSARNWPAPVVT